MYSQSSCLITPPLSCFSSFSTLVDTKSFHLAAIAFFMLLLVNTVGGCFNRITYYFKLLSTVPLSRAITT